MPRTMTVLIVENREQLRGHFARILRGKGFETRSADSAREALETFRNPLGEIHIVLLDISLPDGSGLDIIGPLRRIDPHVVILVISAYLDDDDADYREIANRKGVFDIIAKDIHVDSNLERLAVQAMIYREVLDHCQRAESLQEQLENEPINRLDFGRFVAHSLRLLALPFHDSTRVRLVAATPLEAVWELAPDEIKHLMLDPHSPDSRQLLNLMKDDASSVWLRPADGDPEAVWVRSLAPEDFPLEGGAVLIPLAPSDQILGFLELSRDRLDYRHYRILEAWRRFCDLWSVRLLTRVNAALEQQARLRQLRYTIHQLSNLSRTFVPFIDALPDPLTRRQFERQLEELNTEISQLRNEKNLLSPTVTDPAPYDPNLILFEVQHRQVGQLEDLGAQCQLDFDERICAVLLDEVKFRSAIENLVINAIEALSGADLETAPEVGLKSELRGYGKVMIEVWDNGPGIPADVSDPFDRRYSSKGPPGDRGEGLDLVRDVISQMGGTIEYGAREPAGSRFILTFDHVESAPP